MRNTMSDTTTLVTKFETSFITSVAAAAVEFNIGGDDMVDMKRLPSSVKDFASLVDHLRDIRKELENPKPDTATSGKKKLYKMGVLAIHAIKMWLDTAGDDDWGASVADISKRVVKLAGKKDPPGLSKSATTLWGKTFVDGNARIVVMVALIIKFGNEVRTPVPPPTTTDATAGG